MRKILSIIVVVVVVGIIIAVVNNSGKLDSSDSTAPGSTPLTAEQQKALEQDKAAVVSTTTASRYVHPRLGFSFEKPEGYTVGAIRGDDGSETLIVQSANSGSAQNGFQIFINPLDEPLEITPNVIKSELPGTSINNAQAIELDGRGKGMMFSSNNDAFGGKSYEIWFINPEPSGVGAAGHLYQITSYAEFASQLQKIIGTWKF